MTQPAENIGLSETDAGFDRRLVTRLSRPRRQHADAVVRGHRGVGAVQLGVVERGLVDAALEIVRHQKTWRGPIEPKHADVRANPVRQGLRPGCLGIGQVRCAQHGDENLRHAHFTGERVDDRHPLAGIVDERFVSGDVGLAHRRRQAALKRPVQLTEAAVTVCLWMNRGVLFPQDQQADPRPLHLAHQQSPVRFGMTASARFIAGRGKQTLFQRLVGQVGR